MFRRLPPLAAVAWLIALAALVGLGFAVAHYLSGAGAMTADALSRGGMSTMQDMGGMSGLHRPLFGSALVTAWQLDAVALAAIVVLAALYLTGVALVARRTPRMTWPLRRTVSFMVGLAVCAWATNGSVAVYDQVLFSAHMLGHLALVMVGPAFLMAGCPISLLLAALRPARRDRVKRLLTGRVVSVLTAPPVALAVYTVVIVGSHLTGLMNVIMRNTWAGQVEHLVYVVTGCWFFVLVVGDFPLRWKLSAPARWLLLAIGMAVDTFVGIVLLQQTAPVDMAPSMLGVDRLSDTHTGGAIMWFGGDAVMAAVMIVLVVGWLRRIDTAPVERGWLEQARSATFTQHTGHATPASVTAGGTGTVDDDDAARAAYNEWLARLDQR